jgi:hypothetical protein
MPVQPKKPILTFLVISFLTVIGGEGVSARSSKLGPCPSKTKAIRTHCQGTLTFPDGTKYVGEFRDDEKSGHGSLTLPNGETYVGEFRDNEKNGQGTYTWPSGATYVGEFRDDEKSGQGSYTWPSGKKYVGEFREDQKNGRGVLFGSGGFTETSGIWKDDEYVGAE